MDLKKFWSFVLVCACVVGCFGTASGASVSDDEIVYLEDLQCELLDMSDIDWVIPETRSTESLNVSISGNGKKLLGSGSKSLAANETVTFDCTYTPSTASVDFGLIDSSNHFHYVNVTSGSIDQSIRISQSGSYYLAIRNNSSGTVTVTGTVSY